jgi:hypothetical protein
VGRCPGKFRIVNPEQDPHGRKRPSNISPKGVDHYAGLEDGSVHTLDFSSLVLLGELKMELNVSFFARAL